jgi:hypothetical protein
VPEITIELTAAEDKAFRHIAQDPLEWIQNATGHRIGTIIDKLYNLEVEYSVINPTIETVPTDRLEAALSWIERNSTTEPKYPTESFDPDAPFPS